MADVPESAEQAFRIAADLFRVGEYAKAKAAYESVLAIEPDNTAVYGLLGSVCIAMDDGELGIHYLQLALASTPGDTDVLNNLVITLLQTGCWKYAEQLCRDALIINTTEASIHANLGNCLLNRGEFDKALECFQAALQLNRSQPEVLYHASKALHAMCQTREAISALREAILLNPNESKYYTALGECLHREDKFDAAEHVYRRAMVIDPYNASVLNGLANVLTSKRQFAESIQYYQRAVSLEGTNLDVRLNLAHALVEIGDLDEAWRQCELIVEADPDYVGPYLCMGTIKRIMGSGEEAAELFRTAIRRNPRVGYCYRQLTSAKTLTQDDPEIPEMKRLLADDRLANSERVELHFALGKAYEDLQEYDLSFEHLAKANRMHRDRLNFDVSMHMKLMSRVTSIFSEDFIRNPNLPFGSGSECPVFIVGVPRSGTTLVEQIIASHPQAAAGGETGALIDVVTTELPKIIGLGIEFPECSRAIRSPDAKQIASMYLERLTEHTPHARRVTDKLPLNFILVGIISILFPQAKIIHCRRDPVDTCLSCFFQMFANGHEYTYDLIEMGRWYQAYEAMMSHWRQVLPDRMLEIQYEDLVANQEAKTRKIVDHIGLPWDDRCLSYYENRQPVQTASNVQVKQPIFTTSIGRSEPYKKHLQPLLQALGRLDNPSSDWSLWPDQAGVISMNSWEM